MVRHRLMAGVIAAAIALGGTVQARPMQAGSADAKAAPAAQVNLNSATASDLEKLPGIGPAMAQRIIEYRQKNGAFKKPEDLMNVKGIGERSFVRLKPLITIAPAR
jgi:competence protein ComEA